MAFPLLLLLAAQAASIVAEPPVDWDKEFGVEQAARDPLTGELPLAPYAQSNENAGARQFTGTAMAEVFGGQDGIRRITGRVVELSEKDPRTAAVFKSHDIVRLRRTLFEQFCFILNAGCDYSGRDMKAAHKDMGLRMADLNALVENLQLAMSEARIPFGTQNRLLAKLAPMDHDVLER